MVNKEQIWNFTQTEMVVVIPVQTLEHMSVALGWSLSSWISGCLDLMLLRKHIAADERRIIREPAVIHQKYIRSGAYQDSQLFISCNKEL